MKPRTKLSFILIFVCLCLFSFNCKNEKHRVVLAVPNWQGSRIFVGNKIVDLWGEFKKAESDTSKRLPECNLYMGYVTGCADMAQNIYFAYPSGVTVNQICNIVGNYLDKNPERWTEPANFLVILALAEAFPFKK